MRLTDLAVRQLPIPERGQTEYADETLPGFCVRVSHAGTKTFSVVMRKPQRTRVSIGKYPVITLSDARMEAKRILAEKTLGKNRPKRITFDAALETFVAEKKTKNRARTISENERILRKYWKPLHKAQLTDLTADDLEKHLKKLKGVPGTQLHAFWTVRTFLRWCVKRRYIPFNPLDALDAPQKAPSRKRVLTPAELRSVLDVSASAGRYGLLLLMLAYTGQRRQEIASLRREWFNEAERTITLPDWLTKNHREHTFPYGALVAELLPALPELGLLFPTETGKPWSNFSKTKKAFDEALTNVPSWTLHDLRRTFRSALASLHVPEIVSEKLLNHITGTQTPLSQVYDRHTYMPEMREAVKRWEEWLGLVRSGALS